MKQLKIKDLENISGIKAHTIRIWEKRYNVFEPERTTTKIRTYSEADLTKLLKITFLINHGIKISQIAKLDEAQLNESVQNIYANKNINEDNYKQLFLNATLQFDERAYHQLMENCIAQYGLQKTYFQFLLPLFEKIGVLWMSGSITPAQEHFISHLIRNSIICATNELNKENKSANIDFILFCPEGEWHEIGLLFYQYLLRKANYSTLYFGQNTPINYVVDVLEQINLNKGVVLSIFSRDHIKQVEELYQSLKEKDLVLCIGGAISQEAIESISGAKSVQSLFDSLITKPS
ncbi:MAG: MerR family transcriptional regulator [Crocinitomicaceae bacterium]|nr:MerR family transcriptional regulator [Crocinitomicaceae bacterium]